MSEYMSDGSNEPLDVIDMLAREHRRLLSYSTQELVSYQDFLMTLVKNKAIKTQEIQEKIMELPTGMQVLHGDFHPGNLMIKPDGEIVIIDCMNVCCGPALYDIARTFFLLREVNEVAADRYLSDMNATKKGVSKYLNIIEECRKYEG